MPQAQQDQTLATAAKYNDQNRQQQLFKANIAYMNQRNLAGDWELGEKKKIAAEHDEDREQQFNAFKTQRHLIPVGPAANVEDAAKTYNSNQAVQQAITNGQLYIHHTSTGPPMAYIIPEDQLSKLNPNVQTGYQYKASDDFKSVVKVPHDIAGNTEDGIATNIRLSNEETQRQNAMRTIDQHLTAVAKADEAEANAKRDRTGEHNYVLGSKDGSPVFYDPKNPTGPLIPAPPGLETAAGAARTEKQQAAAVAAQEKALGPKRDALNYANDYLGRGIFTGPSDEALQDKFFELAKSSSGFKMTGAQIKQLNDSRDLINSMKARAKHAFSPNAPWFADQQRQQIVATMNNLARSHGMTVGRDGHAILPAVAGTLPPLTGDTSWIDHPTGMENIPKPDASARPNAAPLPAPKVGDVVQGRTFLGGNPADRNSWR
jgi:hypothetical protein